MLLNKNERRNLNEVITSKLSISDEVPFDGIFGNDDSDLDSEETYDESEPHYQVAEKTYALTEEYES